MCIGCSPLLLSPCGLGFRGHSGGEAAPEWAPIPQVVPTCVSAGSRRTSPDSDHPKKQKVRNSQKYISRMLYSSPCIRRCPPFRERPRGSRLTHSNRRGPLCDNVISAIASAERIGTVYKMDLPTLAAGTLRDVTCGNSLKLPTTNYSSSKRRNRHKDNQDFKATETITATEALKPTKNTSHVDTGGFGGMRGALRMKPTTSNLQPETSNEERGTSNKQRATINERQA